MDIEQSMECLKLKIKKDNSIIQGMFGDIYEEIRKDNKAIETLITVYEKQQKEIENYQILKDDIEGHNVVYVDTPEFEENYISKDKIKEKIEKIKEDEEFYRERDRMYEFDGKINILKDLLGE